jgi:hypothetical protein
MIGSPKMSQSLRPTLVDSDLVKLAKRCAWLPTTILPLFFQVIETVLYRRRKTWLTLREMTRTTSTGRAKSLWILRASPSSARRALRRDLRLVVLIGLELRLRPPHTSMISALRVLRPHPKWLLPGRRCPHLVRQSSTSAPPPRLPLPHPRPAPPSSATASAICDLRTFSCWAIRSRRGFDVVRALRRLRLARQEG